jgi:hypothetical protein
VNPVDAAGLASLIREFQHELIRLEDDPIRRSEFFTGERTLLFPVPLEGHGFFWCELRSLSPAEVVERGLGAVQ